METRFKMLLPLLLLTLPAVVQAQFTFLTNNGAITITGYTGAGGVVTIPSKTNGLPVTSIGDWAFYFCTNLSSVLIPNTVTNIGQDAFGQCYGLTRMTIPNSVTNLGDYAFSGSYNLTGVYFEGNAPSANSSVFSGDNKATVYYLPGPTGWYTPFGGIPAVLWNPQVQTGGVSFGVRTNRFGFIVTGKSNLVIVVEATTNPAKPAWSPVATNTLTGGSSYFSDAQWTNYPARFYRLRSP